MREIKFRAWHTKHKMMYRAFYILDNGWVRVTDDVSKIGLDRRIKEYKQKKYLNPHDFILMQFTGLKDKNGKEIYEGDILANREVHGDSFYCVVEYQCDGFKGVTVPHRNHCRSLHNMMTDEGAEYNEVIGNIYENSDLLDKLSSKDNG